VFQDHFYLVGPNENLGGQRDLNQQDDIRGMFSKIYAAAEEGSDVRFLSRYDKSATNIKDAELWLQIGQVRVLSIALYASITT
jgi:ABC-type tungstate transport system permease subunit